MELSHRKRSSTHTPPPKMERSSLLQLHSGERIVKNGKKKKNVFHYEMHSVECRAVWGKKIVAESHGNRWPKCHGSAVMRTHDAQRALSHNSKKKKKRKVENEKMKPTAAAPRRCIQMATYWEAIRRHWSGIGKFNRVERCATTIAVIGYVHM